MESPYEAINCNNIKLQSPGFYSSTEQVMGLRGLIAVSKIKNVSW